MQVSVSKRESEMTLDNTDFDDRMKNYRRKNWIEEGLDPDRMEAKFRREKKAKLKQRKEMRKTAALQRKDDVKVIGGDERFKSVDLERFQKNPFANKSVAIKVSAKVAKNKKDGKPSGVKGGGVKKGINKRKIVK